MDSIVNSEVEKSRELSLSSPIGSHVKGGRFQVFNRQRSLHEILNLRKVADVILWRRRNVSIGILAGATSVWVLFEWSRYTLLSLAASVLLLVSILIVWCNAAAILNRVGCIFSAIFRSLIGLFATNNHEYADGLELSDSEPDEGFTPHEADMDDRVTTDIGNEIREPTGVVTPATDASPDSIKPTGGVTPATDASLDSLELNVPGKSPVYEGEGVLPNNIEGQEPIKPPGGSSLPTDPSLDSLELNEPDKPQIRQGENDLVNEGQEAAPMEFPEISSVDVCDTENIFGRKHRLFKVMCIVSDKQDYSFVEKVQLPEDEVILLCNELVPNSAVNNVGHPPQIRINFDALNQRCLPTIGLYGDKKMMTRIFRNEGLFDDVLLTQMENGKFEAGLYAGVRVASEAEAVMMVFYWHQGEHLKDASRKDVSCNFIRYLVDLCDHIHVCVEGDYPFADLAVSARNTRSKRKRTERLQINLVKNSENDVKLYPGFNVRIHRAVSQILPRRINGIPIFPSMFFCEGYYRCSFLTAEYRAPRVSTKHVEHILNVTELQNVIQTWSMESTVDFTRLPDEHFLCLLKCCWPEEYLKYSNWKSSFDGTPASALNISAAAKKTNAGRFEKPKQFDQEEDRFLAQQKLAKSVKKDTQVVKYIEQFTEEQQSSSRWFWRNSQKIIRLKVSIEEEQKLSVMWKICELAPMKRDMDELNFNPVHRIIPTCTQSFQLAVLNPQTERLLKVVFRKSGELLIFIHDSKESCLYVYNCPRIGSSLYNRKPIYKFRRGFDLLCVDEDTRFVALYDGAKSEIKVYRFDESFQKVDWTGVEVNLGKFSGSKVVTWMHLIPGKREILVVDDANRVRVVELHQKPMMKPRHISLPSPLLKACITVDGSFLIVFRKASETADDVEECQGDPHLMEVDERKAAELGLMLEIYVLADIMTYLKTIRLDVNIKDLDELEVKIMRFRSQDHLIIHHAAIPDFISSRMLITLSAKEIAQVEKVWGKAKFDEQEETIISKPCATLEYIYHIFDKFATSPALLKEFKKDVMFNVLLETGDAGGSSNEKNCMEYLKNLLQQLEIEKGKDFSNTRVQFQVRNFRTWASKGVEMSLLGPGTKMEMGMWIRNLVCLVPIQIARAENNGMVALKDGLQIPPHLSYADSISLTNLMRFGFYDSVLNSWGGNIKVISSMGKQSSGKSYLLNHLSGSLLDVAGGRCTDGVWMTARAAGDKCIYVLLDFEGLGSFERTEQEDMLLSVLNAAISNITIFNKKDFHLDKDTEAVFDRFQNGISLVKQDKKLFKGLFYIAIKDVDKSDVDDLTREFHEKILGICNKSQENFISKMYGGKVEIAAMPPYNRPDYQESLREISETVDEMDSCYENGFTFLTDLKLVIAQLATKDWTPVDGKRVALKVDILRRNVECAINTGCLSSTDDEIKALINFDTLEEIADPPVVIEELSFDIKDSGLELARSEEPRAVEDHILCQLRTRLEGVLPRKGRDAEWWHSVFESFVSQLADRRRDRVQEWLRSNTRDFHGDVEVQKLQLEAAAALATLKQGLSVCGCKCGECFWRCMLEKGHLSPHSCMGSHSCPEKCSYCAEEGGDENSAEECRDLAGHEGRHDCKMKNHTCGETCELYEQSSNCSKSCSLKLRHPGPHKCNSSQHTCKQKCSLPSCGNPCVVSIEHGDHERHYCHERYCPSQCIMKGCARSCGVKDHFHDLDPKAEHLCGNEHGCPEKCEMPGICEIFTELVRQTRQFQGRRDSFEYEYVSEQNGMRKGCCIVIPPFERGHQGPHVHTNREDALHYCGERCQACGYFCHLPMDHPGLHNTVHGNMRNVNFISETEEIDIEGRKYAWGETGIAEMCNMHCKRQGRGHIHLIPCPQRLDGQGNCTTSKLYDGSRHATRKYGPDVDVAKDEMTHETYWKYNRFVDPCTEEEQQEFGLCPHYCRSEEHDDPSNRGAQKSYCTEKLWHDPIKRTGPTTTSAGYITDDGHHFGCDHSKDVPHHVIFVIDKSGSMSCGDIRPTMSIFVASHNCRLGCVYEAMLRFIRTRLRTFSMDSVSVVLFDESAVLAVEMQDMNEDIIDRLLQYEADGGTTYSSGLEVAERVMIKSAAHPTIGDKKPFIVFLSDGGNNGGGDPLYHVNRMKQQEPRMSLHTIMFGTDPTTAILIEMANLGNGTFQQSLNEVQLARSFENLATSLRPQVAALM